MDSDEFFSLDSYLHAELIQKSSHLWEALRDLGSYLRDQKLGRIEVEIPSSVYLVNPSLISIGEGTRIEPGAYIEGPCIIGPRSVIRHGAYIRGDVLTGEECIIGHGTEIKHSILLDRSSAAHLNYVGDSILGNGVNVGAGVKCANLRLDRRLISLRFNGKKVATSLKKLGAIIGDGAQIGCNTVLNPGTVIGRDAVCYPCLNVSGYVPHKATLKRGD
jgi:UDP-N-acetylglucosamine diphosphorylase / glucose-1-phosphate thymidylyltransferase / UDP-N-acetylgalactosamine diphosphorylase / glucosamine-1-phosphate N-acetyltransferase / galactosamine-1-phosphate N-acetyltransferase